MFLSALVDAGLPLEYLTEKLRQLRLHEFEGVTAQKVHKGAVEATQIRFEIHDHEEDEHDDHDHDCDDDHDHDAGGDSDHACGHAHEHHHRHLHDIRDLIETSDLSERVKQTSFKMFLQLAEAEAKVHGMPIEEVHFHEVGALDSILDIVGAAAGLEYFDAEAIFSSALPLGSGQVQTEHGLLPLPAPATMELIRRAQAPVVPSRAIVELVTPTGAAILAALASFHQPEMKMLSIGIGAGQHDLEWPNILRVMIGQSGQVERAYVEIETNIDDMNPQIYGSVMANLYNIGAADVSFAPIYMKKNRPATKISVIAKKEIEPQICKLLLRETSTLGVSVHPIVMHEAEWKSQVIQTPYGPVPVKQKIIDEEIVQSTPEFDVCVRLAEENQIPVARIIMEIGSVACGKQA
jgi:uncharacterized protein (TIGR00299 family) protein